jgi:hypothetical protein
MGAENLSLAGFPAQVFVHAKFAEHNQTPFYPYAYLRSVAYLKASWSDLPSLIAAL